MKSYYLQQTLNINKYYVIGLILLLPFIFLPGTDFPGRLTQGNFSHPNTAFYNYLSQIVLYAQYRGQIPLLWTVLVFSPILAAPFNLISFINSLKNWNKKLTAGKLIFATPLAVIIMSLGFLFVFIAFFHDTVPCFFRHFMTYDLENFGNAISVCRKA